ncbi:hypothetical protein GCM10027321_39890 [Massilia terrae]|uniref:Uncharacterized protein n=1 Tax=Massilia terrae TaxID=1811224 RepID=A0ABT2D1B8_9BURK|nr:hypothetical protein [Massilia terrae]MCS0659830.1 hypothetical protein [Massilia terrae]
MIRFTNLRYVSASGTDAPVELSHPDNPLTGETARARAVSDARNRAIVWEYAGTTHEFRPKYGWAALDPLTDLLVVVVGTSDLPSPDNAVVINPDGGVDHQIKSPGVVELAEGGNPPERYPVEGMSDVYVDENQQVVIGLNYCREWVERRLYDVAKREWGPRVVTYRK